MQPASRQRSAGSRLLVDLVHHAPASLQGAPDPALVDSGSHDLPRAVRSGVADLSDAALVSTR